MGSITVSKLGKAFKEYPRRWLRLVEWMDPRKKIYHCNHWVLKDINFTVNAGEAVGIVGINGAGKSTLLKLISGTSFPTTGAVEVNGRVAAILELGMGFHPDFTGRENAIMAGQMMGFRSDEVSALMCEIESFADIGEYIDKPIRIYSSGMQARLAFAVATARRPDILIVDEALSVGDVKFQAKCFDRIAKYKMQGMTLLIVSHAVFDLVKHCNRAIFIHDGRVKLDGNAKDVVNVYLDTLFGKSTLDPLKSDGSASTDSPLEATEGRFEDRPGYRKEEYRWGEGGARIVDFYLSSNGASYPNVVKTCDELEISFSVLFDRDFEYITPGILIKSLEGIFIFGSNSHIVTKGLQPISARQGDKKIFKFSFPNLLNEGTYLISLGVSSGDPNFETSPIDRRYDSIFLSVVNPVHMWGIVDLGASFDLVEGKHAA